MPKQYTIMVIPDISGKLRRFSISEKSAKILLSVFILITFTSVFLFYRHIKLSKEVVELEGLRKETREQRLQIQQFVQKVKDFEQQMARLERFDRKLRVITSLEGGGTASSSQKWGVGGIDDRETDSYASIAPAEDKNVIRGLNKDIDELNSQARFQEISFQELDEFFKGQESLLSSTPSIWPTRGWVTSGFGYRLSPFTERKEVHEGIDIATRMNAPVISPADGIVVRSGKDSSYGNILEIDHGYGLVTRYGHNARLLVNMGDKVKRGQAVAQVGNTGRSTGPHLHYEVILNGVPVNPFRYILEES
jgi:murein DD-endopeptidase MepM/ murein hydrolase activator NlpD